MSPYTAPLLEHNPDIDRILVDRGESPGRLADRIRNERFDAAIVAYPRWRIVWALWLARVPAAHRPGEQGLLRPLEQARPAAPLEGDEARGGLQPGAPRAPRGSVQAISHAIRRDRRRTKSGATRSRGEGDLRRQARRDPPSGLGGLLGALAARAFHGAGREASGGRMRSRRDRRPGRELPGPLDREETTSPPISP